MIINHNLGAMNANRNANINANSAAKSMNKLSTGLRINSAGDDAAGLAISEKMRGQIRGLDQASANSQDGISMIQTAEGALNETHSILQRMRELAVQGSTDTNTSTDRGNIQDEVDQLGKEIDRIANQTQFNTKNLLDGSMGAAVNNQSSIDVNTTLLGSGGAASLASNSTLMGFQSAAGVNLGIVTGDVVTVSYVKNGATISNNITVTGGEVLTDLALGGGLTFTVSTGATGEGTANFKAVAANSGFANGIYGLTISVASSAGVNKVAATNALSAFAETTSAQDKRLDGSATLQIGANSGQNINLSINNMTTAALGVANLKVSTQTQANEAIKVIDQATAKVSVERSKLGANANRLEHTIANLGTSSENLTSAESRIRDVDMAKEMSTYSKNNILSQAAQAMIAQANQQPQQVLQLLR
jgi:flagellin